MEYICQYVSQKKSKKTRNIQTETCNVQMWNPDGISFAVALMVELKYYHMMFLNSDRVLVIKSVHVCNQELWCKN